MHPEAVHFTVFVKSHFGSWFEGKRVLDVGSGDINGNNRYLFENCEYDGNDVVEAKNVTIVSKTKDLKFEDETFDTIISTECFEHDPEFKESIKNIYRMLKKDGIFAFTCASTGRPEHGTRRTSKADSYGTIGGIEDMQDHYKNIDMNYLMEAIDLDENFSSWRCWFNYSTCDLYFVGVKRGELDKSIPKYTERGVVQKGYGGNAE